MSHAACKDGFRRNSHATAEVLIFLFSCFIDDDSSVSRAKHCCVKGMIKLVSGLSTVHKAQGVLREIALHDTCCSCCRVYIRLCAQASQTVGNTALVSFFAGVIFGPERVREEPTEAPLSQNIHTGVLGIKSSAYIPT